MNFDPGKILKREALLREKNNTFFFLDTPLNVNPSKDVDPADKKKWSYWRKNNFDFFQSELAKLSRDKILIDLGAGQSDFLELTSKFNLCAVDFYPYEGINVVCDFNKGLPFKNDSTDIIMMSNLLEHVAEPNFLLAECRRVLKTGGIILGTVPFMINIHQRPYDYYRYTDTNLEYLLKKYGFQNIFIKPVLAGHIMLFNALTNFFKAAIGKKSIFLRIIWWKIRMLYKIFGNWFAELNSDPNTPLGYLFKSEKF